MVQVIHSVLVILIGFALKYLLTAIGVEIDEATFNAIVFGIVTWIVAQLGLDQAIKFAFRYRLLK